MDTNVDLSKLTDNDKKELQQFIMQENQQSLIAKSTFPFLSLSPLFPSPSSFPSLLTTHPIIYGNNANDPASHPHPDRHLLEKVHHGAHLLRETGPQRGELCGELRGSVHGCQYGDSEAFGGVEGGGGFVRG